MKQPNQPTKEEVEETMRNIKSKDPELQIEEIEDED